MTNQRFRGNSFSASAPKIWPPGHPVQKENNSQINPTTLVLLRVSATFSGTRLTGEGQETRSLRQGEGQLQVRVRQGDPLRIQGRLHQRQGKEKHVNYHSQQPVNQSIFKRL